VGVGPLRGGKLSGSPMEENLYSFFGSPKYAINVVGMATGYGLDDQGVGVRVLVGASIFTSPCRPDRLLSSGYWDSFPGGKAAGA
jgi:hypothetical protein